MSTFCPDRPTAVLAAALAALSATAADPPPPRPWPDYQVILWTGDSVHRHPDRFPLFVQRLRELGATAGMAHGRADPAPLVRAGLPYYVENVVNRGLCLKWNSAVRDWDQFVTEWARTRDRAAFVREYGLFDPDWREWSRNEVRAQARRHAPHAPLAMNLRDELSITISANPFDYDFSPPTLAALRGWLRRRHGDLAALNRAWGTAFPSWEAVEPFTTDEIKHRMASGAAHPKGSPDWHAVARTMFVPDDARREPARWNLAPWCEFRTFLDETWAGLLDELRREARAIDPATPVGIEGTQMPHAFGGFDLWRLAQAVDWIEPYDIGAARAIFGSFMEGRPILSTIGEKDEAAARRRLWHLLLEGDRGCIVWWSEDCIDWTAPDWPLTAKGRALAPALHEMRSPLARLLLRARREWDPVAIHYSQPSVQVAWLIESTVDGRTWHRRFSSHEAKVNRQAAQRVEWLRALRRAGYAPRFLAQADIERGALRDGGWRALIMPGSWAVSDAEAERLREFRSAGGALVYEGEPGCFDGIGRLRAAAAFEPRPGPVDVAAEVARVASPAVRIEPPGAPVVATRYTLGPHRLVALEIDAGAQMGEDLRIVETAGGAAAAEIELRLPGAAWIVRLNDGARLGRADRCRLSLSKERPTVLALCATEPPPGDAIAWLSGEAERARR